MDVPAMPHIPGLAEHLPPPPGAVEQSNAVDVAARVHYQLKVTKLAELMPGMVPEALLGQVHCTLQRALSSAQGMDLPINLLQMIAEGQQQVQQQIAGMQQQIAGMQQHIAGMQPQNAGMQQQIAEMQQQMQIGFRSLRAATANVQRRQHNYRTFQTDLPLQAILREGGEGVGTAPAEFPVDGTAISQLSLQQLVALQGAYGEELVLPQGAVAVRRRAFQAFAGCRI